MNNIPVFGFTQPSINKDCNISNPESLLDSDFDTTNNSYISKLLECDNKLSMRGKDQWCKLVCRVAKQKLNFENNCFSSKGSFNELIGIYQKPKTSSLDKDRSRINRFDYFKTQSSLESSIAEYNQNCTGKKKVSSPYEEKKKSKCCCAKGENESLEMGPEFFDYKTFGNVNLFLSRLEGIMLNAIESTKVLRESHTDKGDEYLEVLDLLTSHLKDQETQLDQLNEFRKSSRTIFDMFLANSELNMEGTGDIAEEPEKRTPGFRFEMNTKSQIVSDGIIKCKGTGKLYMKVPIKDELESLNSKTSFDSRDS